MELNTRQAERDDAPTISEFNLAMAAETEHKTLDPAVVRQGVLAVFSRPELGRYFVAEQDGQVIGQLMLTPEWSDWRNGMFWWIQSVYVRPDHRRRGVFRALYCHVEELARRTRGICGLRLYVEADNQWAQAAYRELGMRPSGHSIYETDWALSPGETS